MEILRRPSDGGKEIQGKHHKRKKIESVFFLDVRHTLEWHMDYREPLDDKHKYVIQI